MQVTRCRCVLRKILRVNTARSTRNGQDLLEYGLAGGAPRSHRHGPVSTGGNNTINHQFFWKESHATQLFNPALSGGLVAVAFCSSASVSDTARGRIPNEVDRRDGPRSAGFAAIGLLGGLGYTRYVGLGIARRHPRGRTRADDAPGHLPERPGRGASS